MIHTIISSSQIRGTGSFISSWNTANTSTGSSASNQIKLPIFSGGTYNFSVNWGDGSTSNITAYNQLEVTHTYAVSGVYTISIKGTLVGWKFNNTEDKLKLLSIYQWGCLKLANSGNSGYFYGCTNLTLNTVIDVLNLTGVTTLNSLFTNCTSLTTINRINEWNVSSITSMNSTFNGCTNFNSPLSNWNTSSNTDFNNFLISATSFNQDISNFSFASVTTATNFMAGKSAANYLATYYDNLLIAMASQTFTTNGWSISFGTIKRTAASTTARTTLTSSPKNLTITDGGI